MNLEVVAQDSPTISEGPFEGVGRKGRGHPDTICDLLVENAATNLSQFYLRHCGRALTVTPVLLGSVRIGDDVEIGANTTIDRGAIDDTVLENGVKLDNQIQVGHNVVIGAHTAIAACTGISGSTVIGERCMIGGMVGFAGHLSIANDVTITGYSLVSASIKQAGTFSSGMPTVEARRWRRMVASLRRLADKER